MGASKRAERASSRVGGSTASYWTAVSASTRVRFGSSRSSSTPIPPTISGTGTFTSRPTATRMGRFGTSSRSGRTGRTSGLPGRRPSTSRSSSVSPRARGVFSRRETRYSTRNPPSARATTTSDTRATTPGCCGGSRLGNASTFRRASRAITASRTELVRSWVTPSPRNMFLDSHGPDSAWFPALIGLYAGSAGTVVAARRRPLALVVAAGAVSAAGAAIALSEKRPADAATMAWVTPLYAAAHVLGMWRGLGMFVRARLVPRP